MESGSLRGRMLSAAGVLALTAASFALATGTAGAAQAVVTCPVVDPTTGQVSPAPASGVDWSGCNLSSAVLTGADLSTANLSQANLTNAGLSNANLSGASLAGANLTAAFMQGTNLASASLTGADLTQALVRNASLDKTDLTGATLTGVNSRLITGTPAHLPANWSLVKGSLIGPGANLINDQLTRADLSRTDLAGAQLDGADLTGANLSHANLTGASLVETILTSANLDATNLASATLTAIVSGGITGTPAALPVHWLLRAGFLMGPGIDLSGDNLAGRGLAGVDLSGANLSRVNLTGANLSKANLAHANLTSATLTGANLFRAVLTGAIWSGTACPDGTNSGTSAAGCTKALAYHFGGFSSPKPGSSVRKSARSFSARFKLTNAKGAKVSAAIGRSLAHNHEVRATLSGPGITPVNATCRWNAAAINFRCTIKFPATVKTGASHRYTVVVSENSGKGFAQAPKRAGVATQLHIHFKK
jgi:uncharacterized protein YjbI with pentapeptide repeats